MVVFQIIQFLLDVLTEWSQDHHMIGEIDFARRFDDAQVYQSKLDVERIVKLKFINYIFF